MIDKLPAVITDYYGGPHQGTAVADAARHITRYVPDPRVIELASAGHFAPLIAPAAMAEELIRFFQSPRNESARNTSAGMAGRIG